MKKFTYISVVMFLMIISGCTKQNIPSPNPATTLQDEVKVSPNPAKKINKVLDLKAESSNFQIESISPEIPRKNIPKSWYKPKPRTSWQWQLTGKINTTHDAELYDVDLEKTPQKTIDQLHNQGKKVICYFNGGAYEPYRSDSAKFLPESLGEVMEGWEDEKWLDIAHYKKFSDIMEARLDLAVEKKCDGVEPDNVDGFQNKSVFPLTYNDQLRYNKWLATEAHQRNLTIALKNDLDQIEDLVDFFDFAINEECFEYEECEKLLPFIEQKKAVLGVEYELNTAKFCPKANRLNFSWLKMDLDLDGGRISCF